MCTSIISNIMVPELRAPNKLELLVTAFFNDDDLEKVRFRSVLQDVLGIRPSSTLDEARGGQIHIQQLHMQLWKPASRCLHISIKVPR